MRLRLVPAWLVCALLVPSAAAFTSVPPGSSVHDEITAVAKDAGWSDGATKALQQAVREPDFQETKLDPDGDQPTRIDATASYRAEHHCDRIPPMPDAQAFDATVAYVQGQRNEAANHSAAGNPEQAMEALGRALHALQDCYSHSNIVDLPDQQQAFEDILLNGGAAVPGLRLVSFEPHADDPERPAGDDYPHGEFAKDEKDGNPEARAVLADNRTKFEAARDLARLATVAFLQEFMRERGAAEQAALMGVKPEDGGVPDDLNIPGPAPTWFAIALLAVALTRRPR